ncbi:hypothetical protein PRZ48_004719 [Zasmidium cellare]|uniref:Uncharacterized protein n=1 Tax=Zasmidium cellare TaxID=395010 RepID=A0ABR0EQZ6_ZASCE|nr:hypothetical protein PRZ48_004719 [Zasmidium cellare]
MQTAIPRTANPMEEGSLANEVFQGERYEWLNKMAEDRKSVLISFWLPQWMAPASLDVRSVPATEYSVVFPTYVQYHMLDLYDPGPTSTPEAVPKEKTVPQKVAVGVSVPLAAVLVFLFIWLLIRLRAQRRQQQQDEEQSPLPSPKRTKHKRDYNAKPLFPHKPLTGLSETSFTTDPQPSYGAILKQRLRDENNDNDQAESAPMPNLPELRGSPTERLPELPGSPTEETELLPTASSSSDDFGTHFSGLEDPFSDARIAELPSPIPERRAMTPGVSPSSYPLRDRLSHESGRRRQAIEAVRSEEGSWRGSVGEEELRRMGRAFELEGEENLLTKQTQMNLLSDSNTSIATPLSLDIPLLYDTSTLAPNGSPYSIARMSTPTHYTYAPTTHAAKPTVKYGWPISAHPTSTHTTHSSTSTPAPHTTTVDPLVRTTPVPEDDGKPRDGISPLFIALVVLGVVVLVVAVVLIWGTWLKRRRQNLAKSIDEVEEEGDGRQAFQEKRVIREPELSWMTGPTLINEEAPHWSARTLVSPTASQGVERGRRTTPPPIPPRAVNRRPVPVPGQDRELPSTPMASTSLRTPVSPISPARRRPEVIDEDEILPVVDNDSYRPSPVSPLDSVSFTRSRSRR